MRIGIAAPIEVASLIKHLPNLSNKDTTLGLGGTAINILIDGFIDNGHHVTVFTLDSKIKDTYVLQGPNLKIIMGHFRATSVVKWFDFCYKECTQIRNFINSETDQVDIVNAHWSYEYAIGTILSKCLHLVTFRDHAQTILKLTKHPYRVTRLLMDTWVRSKAKHICYNSEYLKNLIGINGPVIPNPIKNSEIREARQFPLQKEKLEICFIANGSDHRKNPRAALEGFKLYLQSESNIEKATLSFIGSGFEPEGDFCREMMALGLNNNVIYCGPISHARLMLELERFDIMLHTAREESFGNNLLEAMAKGIPVIGGEASGAVSWVLENGISGCLVNVESAVDIANKLQILIQDHTYYEQLSVNGIANVKRRFSQGSVCDSYIYEYNDIIVNSK